MAQPVRFTFDLDLGARPSRPEPAGRLDAGAVDAARLAGFAEGETEGRRRARSEAELRLASAAEALAGRALDMLAALDAARAELAASATRLCRQIAGKLATALVAAQPEAELEALFAECLVGLEDARHLVIRCHPDLAAPMQQAAEARMLGSAFTGRLIVMGDPEIALGDGRFEWADGGIVRDSAAIEAAIDAAIARYLATHAPSGAETPR